MFGNFHPRVPMAGKWFSELGSPDPTPGSLELRLLFPVTGPSFSTHELLYFFPRLLANTLLTQMHLLLRAWLDALCSIASLFLLEGTPTPWGPLHSLLVDPYSALVCLCLPVLPCSLKEGLSVGWRGKLGDQAASAHAEAASCTSHLRSSWLGSSPSLNEPYSFRGVT